MKKTPLRRISDRRKALLEKETIQTQILLENCGGLCMTCGQKPDFRGLQKSHTRNRKRFILECANCHSPKGEHRYLPDEKVKEIKDGNIIR